MIIKVVCCIAGRDGEQLVPPTNHDRHELCASRTLNNPGILQPFRYNQLDSSVPFRRMYSNKLKSECCTRCCYCIRDAMRTTPIEQVLLEYGEPTERCIYLYIIIYFFSILNTRGKKSEYILLPLVGCFAVNVNMWNREKMRIKSISHMEFMRFYVNCGTRLEYYMRSHLWHRYNNIHGLTQWNNTREGAP